MAVVAAVSAGAASAQTTCAPTRNSGGGPGGAPPPLRAKIGTGHVLTGIVLSPACTPFRGARVSFRQANAKGVYLPAGTGAVRTNGAGRSRFEGPRPKGYSGRAPHIHIVVEAPGFETLSTEFFPRSSRGHVRYVLFRAEL